MPIDELLAVATMSALSLLITDRQNVSLNKNTLLNFGIITAKLLQMMSLHKKLKVKILAFRRIFL